LTMLISHLTPAVAAQAEYFQSAAFHWTDIALEATAREVDRDGARPTVISRTLSIVITAMYDAWAAYDDKALGSRFGGRLRRPASERTLENKSTAIAYSKRDNYDLDHDVKLFFTVANVAFGAFIAAWQAKRVYDTPRPWTLVPYYYKGQKICGWLGPGQGVGELLAEDWHPYSPFSFVTPPFPGYVSGHSTVSGACAMVLALFTGSDRFGVTETRNAGILTEPDAACTNCEVKLTMPTFTEAAKMAGISRVLGGYHIQADNIEGLK